MIETTEKKEYRLTKEILDQMRTIKGFPLGKDEDIIALSDPLYYTACPNPWIGEFIKEHGKSYDPATDTYQREPFAADVSEGKNDPIYNAHSYHTKVPHKAIMRYILHYTEPGDIVFDGFCGTGMAGVAAQLCGNPDPEFKEQIEREMPYIKWGVRKAILNDLSPAATFIAYNYNTPVDVVKLEREAKRIIAEVERECGWMYETPHLVDGKPILTEEIDGAKRQVKGRINFTVWSDVFICPSCAKEMTFWEVAVDLEHGQMLDEFHCPHCDASVTKRSLERARESVFDDALQTTIKRAKQVPVLINYSVQDVKGKWKRFEKTPDETDFTLIKKIEEKKIPYWYPTNRMPEGDESRRNDDIGITHVHHFYTKRNLWILSTLFQKVLSFDKEIGRKILFAFNNVQQRHCKMNAFRFNVSFPSNITSGTLYVASLMRESNFFDQLENKILRRLLPIFREKSYSKENFVIETNSAQFTKPQRNSIDYIFVDPPFGGNLMYSELNFLWEAWLKVFTNNQQEALVNTAQRKGLAEYQHIMEECFKEFYSILKPGRWMTVEFHNSQNSVWMAIQEALSRAGFVVADVRTLDKKLGTFKQVTSKGAVKQDLIISAYKPNGGLEERFKLTAGKVEGVWDFARQHLKHLPVVVEKDGVLQVVAERQPHLLFDRMVAFHVQRGVIVPISAGDFYAGLRHRFPERDMMYFLEQEALEYDKKRMIAKRVEQTSLFVHDEKSAVQWLQTELTDHPQTYQDIQPKFLQELHQDKFEKLPELSEILNENFLQDASGKWYVPDPNKQADLDKIREKALLREFEEYKVTRVKLKMFRTEAVRTGFKKCWSERDYATIIAISERLPLQILQEDPDLLMYYDNAVTRAVSK